MKFQEFHWSPGRLGSVRNERSERSEPRAHCLKGSPQRPSKQGMLSQHEGPEGSDLDKWGVFVGSGMGHPTFVQVHLSC